MNGMFLLMLISIIGTSIKTLIHFVQLQKSQKFQAFDYGKQQNVKIYGTPEPISYLDHYDKIDIPIHVLYGSDDLLIPAEGILKHYTALATHKPHLAHAKRFEGIGHLDITLGNDENVIQYVLKEMQKSKVLESS